MKTKTTTIAALLSCVGAYFTGASLLKPAGPGDSKITGDYVEARTASVFAGACHYNGELVCNGREAVMAWSFTGGSANGVSLAGVRVAAAVTSPDSLGNTASRKAELVVDSSASDAQLLAAKQVIQSKVGSQLGEIVSIRRASVNFQHDDKGYAVDVPGLTTMSVQAMADNACCASPQFVWFSPLTPLENRKVGYAEKVTYTGTLTDTWSRFGENDAFYGSFSF